MIYKIIKKKKERTSIYLVWLGWIGLGLQRAEAAEICEAFIYASFEFFYSTSIFNASFALIDVLNYTFAALTNVTVIRLPHPQRSNPPLPQRFNSSRMGCNAAPENVNASLPFSFYVNIVETSIRCRIFEAFQIFIFWVLWQYSARKPLNWFHPQRARKHLYSFRAVHF